MRDPNRISIILDELKKVWEKYPDLRLGQLIGNVFQTISMTSYYMEDQEFINTIKEYYKGV